MFRLIIGALFATILFLGSETVLAQATPSDVLVSVETAQNELKLMYDADLQPAPEVTVTKSAPRQPRHVYFKAREIFLKVQTFRKMNGLPANKLPAVPEMEIKPSDVKALVDSIRMDIAEVKSKYFVTKAAVVAPKLEDKGPTDVYLGLVYMGQLIDGLDMPNVVPNDVYRVALAVLEEARIVSRAVEGEDTDQALEYKVSGKKPFDVYNNGVSLLYSIYRMTKVKKGYDVPGGVVLPSRPRGDIKPSDVMDLMSNTLAELNALKNKFGIKESAANQPEQSGKTPSNVFDVIETTKIVLAGI
jgi:hypothetical protein